MRILTVVRITAAEARQRKMLWAAGVLAVGFLVLFGTAFYYMHRDVSAQAGDRLPEVTNVLLMMGLYVVNFLIVMLAVITSVNAIAGEIASGTIQTVVTRPLRRWEVVLGKWMGLSGMLLVFTAVMCSAMVGIVWCIARYVPPNPVSGIALMMLEGVLILTLSILGSTRLSSLTNGVVVFMLYGLAFIGGWIQHVGGVVQNSVATTIGAVAGFIVPSEAMWKRAAYLMQPPFLRELPVTPFAASSAPGNAMVVYAGVYTAAVLAIAVYSFQRRDL